jgi:hypothetical protein
MNLNEIINSNKNIRTTKIKKNNIINNQYQIIEINNELQKYYNITIKNNKLKIKLNSKNINIFNNIFSKPLQRIIHLSIINWINKQIKNKIFKTTSNLLNQPGVAINYLLFDNYPTKDKEMMRCRILDTTNKILLISPEYKIHINIKLKYLFWVIKHIIDNSDKFIIEINGIKKPLFSHFKIHTDFWNFTILNKEYKTPNIVFYQYQDKDNEITKICFRKLVKLLLNIFPNDLKISSKIYSKFTFKINNNIYLCIGDGIDKINKSEDYTIPLEYQQIKDNNLYDKYKKKINKLSYYDLFDDNTNYLVKKNNNSINKIFNDIGLKEPIKLK